MFSMLNYSYSLKLMLQSITYTLVSHFRFLGGNFPVFVMNFKLIFDQFLVSFLNICIFPFFFFNLNQNASGRPTYTVSKQKFLRKMIIMRFT